MADAPSLTEHEERRGGITYEVGARPMRGIEEAIDSACKRAEETMARLDAVAEESRKVAANLNVILDRLVRILPQQRPIGDVWVDRNSLETGGDDGL